MSSSAQTHLSRRTDRPTTIARGAAEIARTELRGTPASRGQATGIARILRSPEDGALLQAGDIVVCPTITPAWMPLFSIAAGIVSETGGALSSGATIAREYGIAVVVSVEGATTQIRDGQFVSIDGASGVVALRA